METKGGGWKALFLPVNATYFARLHNVELSEWLYTKGGTCLLELNRDYLIVATVEVSTIPAHK